VPVRAMERLMEECGRPAPAAPASRRLTHRTAKIARI